MAKIDDIIGATKLPEQTVSICTRADLVSLHQALSAELEDYPSDAPQSHLAAVDPRAPLAQRIVDLESEMRDSEVPFTFRALGRRKYVELKEAHALEGFNYDPATFPQALIAACAIDPEMSVTDVERLFDVISSGAVEVLFSAAYGINEGLSRVPFSKAASDLTRRIEKTS